MRGDARDLAPSFIPFWVRFLRWFCHGERMKRRAAAKIGNRDPSLLLLQDCGDLLLAEPAARQVRVLCPGQNELQTRLARRINVTSAEPRKQLRERVSVPLIAMVIPCA